MTSKKITILLFAVLFLSALGTSAVVTNSEDWRDSSIGLAYSHYTGQNFHAITGYSEALIVSGVLGNNNSHTVIESREPVWDGYEDKLRNEGVKKVETRETTWERAQYEFYSEVEEDIEGFVVLKPGYGIDTISVFPLVTAFDYWPIYYQGESTESFLKRKDKPIIFYGEMLQQPWKKIEGKHEVIAEGNKDRNNRRMVDELFQDYDRKEIVVTDDGFLEKGSLKKGNPIVVDQSVEKTAQIVERYGVEFVEVIGSANVNFGSSLENNLGDDVTVIAKFGRKFTGAGGLGETYPLKKIPSRPVERDVSIENVKFDKQNSGLVELVFTNEGTIATDLELSAVSLENNDNTELISNPESIVLRPGRDTTIEFKSNLSFVPERASASFSYRGSETSIDGASNSVSETNESSLTDIELKDLYYYEPAEEIVIELKNTGERDAWVSGQVQGLDIMNRSTSALSEEQKKIDSGGSKRLQVEAYLTDEQIDQNKELDVAVTYGASRGYAEDLERFSNVKVSVKEATLADIAVTYGVPLIIILIIILVILYLRRRRKMKKELRGLK